MAKSRKDNKGRVLRKGETQRSCDGKYVYTYTDPEGKRRSIYSKDIMELLSLIHISEPTRRS